MVENLGMVNDMGSTKKSHRKCSYAVAERKHV